MNSRIPPMNKYERRALGLLCLYVGAKGEPLSSGEITKFVSRYGKGSATKAQIEADIRDFVGSEYVWIHRKELEKKVLRRYSLAYAGMLGFLSLTSHLPKPILERVIPHLQHVYTETDGLYRLITENKVIELEGNGK